MIYGTILCLGDSLTFGARAEFGYPEILPTLLTARDKTEWATLNRGISGETTRQILARTPGALRELVSLSGPKQMVVLAGTNDSKWVEERARRGEAGRISIDGYEDLMRQILHWPRRFEVPTILCTLPPVNHVPMPAFDEDSFRWTLEASERVRQLGDEFHMRIASLEDMPRAFLSDDGVHLTQVGYEWVATRIATAMGTPGLEEPTP